MCQVNNGRVQKNWFQTSPGALETSHGIQERPAGVPASSEHVPGMSQDHPESPRRRPGTRKRPPGRVRERAETPKIIAEPRPEMKKNNFFVRSLSMKHRWTIFLPILVDFQSVGKVCEPLKVPRLPAKTRVRPSALQVESRTHCTLEKERKLVPKR